MSRFWSIVGAWTVVLVVGFLLVFTLGAGLATDEELLAQAMHPTPPVSESAARSAAATIVRLQYGEFADVEPTVQQRTDFGIPFWVISYVSPPEEPRAAVQISIVVESGSVHVVTVP